jgi:hypothetical protein
MVVYFIIPWYYNGVHIGIRVSIYIYMKAFQYANQIKLNITRYFTKANHKSQTIKIEYVLEYLLHPF